MSISKLKKIIIFFLFIVFCGNIISPASVFAEDQAISIQCYSINQNGTTKKWSLGFKITTVNVKDGTKVYDYLYDKGINLTEGNKISTIKNNYAEYLTGQILDSETKYTVTATVVGTPKLTTSVTVTTPKDGEQATSCTPSNPETSQTITNTTTTNSTTTSESTDTTYTLLAPLPGLETTIDTKISAENPCPFGNYLNILIKLFLGVCAVLAVVMIVMGGIEYMTSDLVSSKESGKKMITNAVLGLLLGLGAYVILYELNPDLLKICLNSLPEETITLMDEKESSGMTSGTVFSGSTKFCTEGITSVGTKGGSISICKKLNTSGIASTINSAWNNNKKLSGFGYRTTARQIELRKKNCNGNTTDKNANCDPATALPGTSRHENGLAIDFTCGGVSIQTKDNECYLWLKQNASTHKLKNLNSEPWHWSSDGH